MPAGRPTKYDPAMCERVIELGKEGRSKAELAAELDISRVTLDAWAAANPEFLSALHRANDLSLAWWEREGRTGLVKIGFNAGLYKQCMSGRFPSEPYRERVEHTGKDGGPIESKSQLDVSGVPTDALRAVAGVRLPADS